MSESRSSVVARRDRMRPDPTRRLWLTDRDRAVLTDVFLMRALTRRHLQALGHFSSTVVANTRLRALFDLGFLRRTFVPAGAYATEAVYLTGRAAVSELVLETGLERAEIRRLALQHAPAFLEHSLAVADTRVAFEQACPPSARMQWITEPEARHAYTVASPAGTSLHILKPDAAVLLSTETGLHLYFLEVDRGHVSSPQFQASCASYRRYIERGLAREVYKTSAVTVLCVTTGGDRRIANLAAAASREALTVRFAAAKDVAAVGPFGSVWRARVGDAKGPLVREVRG
jgi:hypothetical protein